MSQSTNDVFPTVLRIASLWMIERKLYPAADTLKQVFELKSREFDDVIKAVRTHLQDAMPVRLGQEFAGYASAIGTACEAVKTAAVNLHRVNLGGTAVGTGINTPPGYRETVVRKLSEITGLELRPAENLFEVTESAADFSFVSSALKVLALELIRIANDIRLLSSGPRTGLGEIRLPVVQPGSSIMPGKVNPSIAEMVDMVSFQVVGNDVTVSMAAQAGQLELNVMLPVIAHNLLQSISILSSAMTVFAERCVEGIKANRDIARQYAEISASLITALSPRIGYLAAAEAAKQSVATGKPIREIVLERNLIGQDELDELLDLYRMTETEKVSPEF
jgi:aspartate ammonia-lyase